MVDGARFLVVEDEPVLGRTLARMVRPFGEPVVASTVSSAKGLLASQVPWRGFFIDLGLPDGSGLDVLDTARSAFPRCPAMVLTGRVEADLINAVYDLGAHYVVKPIDAPRVQRFCREGATSSDAAAASSVPAGEPSASGTDRIPETLEGCIERLRELAARRPDPHVRYAMGRVLAAIKGRPGQYGQGGVSAVAAALGEDVPSLYRHAAVAERWTRDEVQALLTRTGPEGRLLSWSHIVLLGSVASAEARLQLVERVLVEGLTVRELAALVTTRTKPSTLPSPGFPSPGLAKSDDGQRTWRPPRLRSGERSALVAPPLPMDSPAPCAYASTVCIRDDDDRTFEFRTTDDPSAIVERVAAAIALGRQVRCYVLPIDSDAQRREESYLVSKGYALRTRAIL